MKSQHERDLDKTFKQQPRKKCVVCGSYEGSSPEGYAVRMLKVHDGWVCNYCNNQKPGA
jgi:hypothetical protein